jgi:hypothetical protein
MTIASATSTVQAIFALHVATAGLAFLLLVGASLIFLGQLKSGSARPAGGFKRASAGPIARPHSSLGTHFWLMSGLFNLMVAYAAQAAVVALQTRIDSPFSITSAYSYPSYGASNGASGADRYGKEISILSFLYQFASILVNVSIIGAIWMYSNHLECNTTRMKAPGFLSWLLNLFWLVAILALGFAYVLHSLYNPLSNTAQILGPCLYCTRQRKHSILLPQYHQHRLPHAHSVRLVHRRRHRCLDERDPRSPAVPDRRKEERHHRRKVLAPLAHTTANIPRTVPPRH